MRTRTSRPDEGVRAEGELVEASRSGDAEAYGELVRRYQRRTLGLALRLLGDAYEAEDAAQEAFLRAWRALPSFESGKGFGPWVLKIAANVALDAARRRRPERLPTDYPEAAPQPSADSNESPRRLEKALAGLPERQREALVLFHHAGLSYEEIAARWGAPVGTVRSSLHRARLALRAALLKEKEPSHELR